MNENNQYMNQIIEGGDYYQPQFNVPPQNTIYIDLQQNSYNNPPQSNSNAPYIPSNINNINSFTGNNNGYTSQNNNIYLSMQNNNEYFLQNNENIYSQNNDNTYTKNKGNIYFQNYENIYSQYNGNIYSKNNENIYSQNKENIYSQNNENIYPSLENKTQPNEDKNNGYNPQISVKSNYAFNAQNIGNSFVPSENFHPVNVENNTIPSSEHLIPPSDEADNAGNNCCQNNNVLMDELDSTQKIFTIISGIFIIITAISNILVVSSIISDYSVTLYIEIIFILYGIFISISFIRNRVLRITTTIFSIIFIFVGIGLCVVHMIYLISLSNKIDIIIPYFSSITYFRLMILICISCRCFCLYYGKYCFINREGVLDYNVHYDHTNTSIHNSQFQNRNSPHLGNHIKSKSKSKSTFI